MYEAEGENNYVKPAGPRASASVSHSGREVKVSFTEDDRIDTELVYDDDDSDEQRVEKLLKLYRAPWRLPDSHFSPTLSPTQQPQQQHSKGKQAKSEKSMHTISALSKAVHKQIIDVYLATYSDPRFWSHSTEDLLRSEMYGQLLQGYPQIKLRVMKANYTFMKEATQIIRDEEPTATTAQGEVQPWVLHRFYSVLIDSQTVNAPQNGHDRESEVLQRMQVEVSVLTRRAVLATKRDIFKEQLAGNPADTWHFDSPQCNPACLPKRGIDEQGLEWSVEPQAKLVFPAIFLVESVALELRSLAAQADYTAFAVIIKHGLSSGLYDTCRIYNTIHGGTRQDSVVVTLTLLFHLLDITDLFSVNFARQRVMFARLLESTVVVQVDQSGMSFRSYLEQNWLDPNSSPFTGRRHNRALAMTLATVLPPKYHNNPITGEPVVTGLHGFPPNYNPEIHLGKEIKLAYDPRNKDTSTLSNTIPSENISLIRPFSADVSIPPLPPGQKISAAAAATHQEALAKIEHAEAQSYLNAIRARGLAEEIEMLEQHAEIVRLRLAAESQGQLQNPLPPLERSSILDIDSALARERTRQAAETAAEKDRVQRVRAATEAASLQAAAAAAAATVAALAKEAAAERAEHLELYGDGPLSGLTHQQLMNRRMEADDPETLYEAEAVDAGYQNTEVNRVRGAAL
jgi:hypothetical protein